MMTQVVEIEGHRIGLIGYITDLTPSITSGDLPNLSFQDVSKAVQYYNMNPIHISLPLRKWRVYKEKLAV